MSTKKTKTEQDREELRNEDPITGAPGSHPVGTGIGAALGGAATGAAVGSVAGPLGTIIGTAVGGITGGLVGKAVAESYDPTVESAYWRDEHRNRPYYNDQYNYDHYEPAYRAGWESYDAEANADWGAQEEIARERWESEGGAEHMTWEEARLASEDAYTRVHSQPKPRAK